MNRQFQPVSYRTPLQSGVLNVDGMDLPKFRPRSGAASVGTNGVRYRKPTQVLPDEKY